MTQEQIRGILQELDSGELSHDQELELLQMLVKEERRRQGIPEPETK